MRGDRNRSATGLSRSTVDQHVGWLVLSLCEISETDGESSAWSGFLFWSTEDQADSVAETLPIDDLGIHLPAAFLGK